MSLLERLARRWRRRWTVVALLAAGASGSFVAAITRALWHGAGLAPGTVAALVVGLTLLRRRGGVNARTVARHLNRTIPALEESAELLLVPETALAPLERLQRRRLEQRLAALAAPPRLPRRATTIGAAYAAIVLLAAAGVLQAGISRALPAVPPRRTSATPPRPPRVVDATIRVRPPPYTGHPERQTAGWDLEVEEGARITWRVRTDRAVEAVWLESGDGDTLRLEPHGSAGYEATATAEHSRLYRVVLRDGAVTVPSDYHRLGVIPDEPPTLTIVHPEPRTRIGPAGSRIVPLEVVAGDDYGVADAHVVATVTTGSGEAVRFRELTLDFATRRAQAAGDRTILLRGALDLAALRMEPGDEIYYSVVAHDRRTPRPNTGRSDTYFIAIADTASVVVADLSGLAASAVPEYLRSQRQIIIDTERLIADAARIATPAFRDRAEAIGFDQQALRMRYGELVGDETVVAGPEPAVEHQHDVEENATLLAQSVKDKLRAALAQMWEAERRLRTHDPRGALPYEYRALTLLKAAQQATRVYVQRTGFEPPPLEPDRKRLSGTLEGIASATHERTDTTVAPMPGVRGGIAVLERLMAGERPRAADAATLERSGREVAALAIAQPEPRHLETLRALRTLIGSLGAPDSLHAARCRDCLLRAARGLWLALPAADPSSPSPRVTGGLAQTYFELLQSRGGP